VLDPRDASWQKLRDRAVGLREKDGVLYVDRVFAYPGDTAPTPSRVVDWAAINARVEGDLDLLREVMALFLADAPGLLANMERAIIAGDVNALGRASHTFRGAV